MVKTLMMTIAFASCTLLAAGSAFAISLEVVPAHASRQLGQSLNVNVVVSGLAAAGEIVSAYDLDLAYAPGVVNATNVDFGTALGGPADSISGFGLSTGLVDLFESSFLSDAALAALQADAVTLATLSFDTTGVGTTGLEFVRDFLSDGSLVIQVIGRNAALLPLLTPDAAITVEPASGIDEPPVMPLALALLIASLSRARRVGHRAIKAG